MARKKSLLSNEAKAAIAAAKWQAKQAKLIYKEKAKEMRPYLKRLRDIDLRKEPTPAQKGYIQKAWNEYRQLTLRPTKVYRSQNKTKLKTVQKITHRDSKVKFDVAFVPTVSENAKIELRGDKLIIKSRYIEEAEIPFNMKALAANPEKELERVIAANPEYTQFVLMAGKYLWNGGIDRQLVKERVLHQLLRYVPGGAGYEKRGPNSHYENWAFGLLGFKAKNQLATEQYLSAYHKKAKEKKQQAKKDRRKRGLKYGTKF